MRIFFAFSIQYSFFSYFLNSLQSVMLFSDLVKVIALDLRMVKREAVLEFLPKLIKNEDIRTII